MEEEGIAAGAGLQKRDAAGLGSRSHGKNEGSRGEVIGKGAL